ncbi:jg14182 [Pararge aegeria aegeria]|uniref:Jg14182 protein n=1 Tax=Pararge aegeria aegeria TaxID=348720 RepID=A0A8S4SE42_9NEOP|nr:jg14182 [Pararge aegeria aegeria]
MVPPKVKSESLRWANTASNLSSNTIQIEPFVPQCTDLLELDDVAVHDARAVGREQQYGRHDEDDVLVGAPARVERADELLVRAVDVALGQLQHVRLNAAVLLVAVRQLRASVPLTTPRGQYIHARRDEE